MRVNEDGYILACPSCDSKDLIKKSRQKNYDGSYKQRYMCKNCGVRTVNPQLLDADIVRANVQLAKQKQSAQDVNRIERKSFREHARYENAVTNLLFNIHEYCKSVIFQNKSLRKLSRGNLWAFFKYLIHILTNLFPYLIIPTILRLLQGV